LTLADRLLEVVSRFTAATEKPNPSGAWFELEQPVIGLAWLGKKEEAAALRTFTEEVLLTGAWGFV
jgi:hypothetical protein